MKFRFWRDDWLSAMVIVLVFCLITQRGFFQQAVYNTHDFGSRLACALGDRISIIAVEDADPARFSRRPGLHLHIAAGGAECLHEPDNGQLNLNDIDIVRLTAAGMIRTALVTAGSCHRDAGLRPEKGRQSYLCHRQRHTPPPAGRQTAIPG